MNVASTSADTQMSARKRNLVKLLRYKQWADRLSFDALAEIPEEEAWKQRRTVFGNMVHTLNHIVVIDDIFRHHLTGQSHRYTKRNTDDTPPIEKVRAAAEAMDQWYLDQVRDWSDDDLDTVVEFGFVGGGEGAMTREEIILHVVNHTTYHRGVFSDMLLQVPYKIPANDLTVYLRDHSRG